MIGQMTSKAAKKFRNAAGGLFVATSLALAPAPAHAFWDTKKAWNDLLQFAVSRVNAPGEFEIELGEVSKPEEGFALISTLKIRDGDGVWLDAKNLLVDWSPSALLRGRFTFETLGAEEIAILRAPITRGDPPAEEAEGVAFAWPRPPVGIKIDKLKIDRLRIEGGLLPQDLEAEIDGAFEDLNDVQIAKLNVKRTDRPEDQINLDAKIDFNDLDIALKLRANEEPGGLVAQMAGLPPEESLKLTLSTNGTPDALPFEVFADIGQIGVAEGTGEARWGKLIAAKFDGTVKPGSETSVKWKEALGESAKIKLDLVEESKGTYALKLLDIDSQAFEMAGKGVVDTAGNKIDLSLDWLAKDIEAFNTVIAPARVSDLSGKARAVGRLTAPKLDIDARVADLEAGFGDAETLLVQIQSEPSAEGDVGNIQKFTFEARAKGLALNDAGLQDALGADPALTGNGAFYGAENRVALETLKIDAKSLTLEGNAGYDITAGTTNAQLSGQATELGPFFRAAGIPVDGMATLAFKLDGLKGGTLERLFLNAQMSDLSSDDPDLAAALGEQAVVELLLTESSADTIQVERGFIESAVVKATASGTVSPPLDTADLSLDWALVDPSAIKGIIAPATIGAASGKARLLGPLSEPSVQVEADTQDLRYLDYAFAKGKIIASGQMRKDRRAPFAVDAVLAGVETGDADLDAVIGAEPKLDIEGLFDTATGLLTINEGVIDLADADVDVSGKVQLTKQTLDVDYALRAGNLEAFSALAGKKLGGSVDLTGRLEGPFALPFVTAKGVGRNLVFDTYRAEVVDLDIETRSGETGTSPFVVDVAAAGILTGDPALDAFLGDTPTIQAAGVLTQKGPLLVLERFDAKLAAATASATGRVDMGERELDIEFDVNAKNLSGLKSLVGKTVSGSVITQGRASGSFSAPEVDAVISGQKLRYDSYSIGSIDGDIDIQQAATGFAPFNVALDARDIVTGDKELDKLLSGASKVTAKGAFNQSKQVLRITDADIRAAKARAMLNGTVDLGAKRVDVAFDVDAPALAPFSGLVGSPLDGGIRARGKAKGPFAAPGLDVTLDGSNLAYQDYRAETLAGSLTFERKAKGYSPFDVDLRGSGLSLGDPALDEALGDTVTIDAKGGFDIAAKRVRLDGANVVSDAATIEASGSVDLAAKTLDLSYDLDAKRLAAFGPLVKADLGGKLKAKGTAKGDFVIPAVKTTIDGEAITFNQFAVGRINGAVDIGAEKNGKMPFDVDLTALGLATGDPALDAALTGGIKIASRGEFEKDKPAVQLAFARLDAEFAKVSADGRIDIGGQTLDLNFDVDAGDLSPIGAVTGASVSGKLAAKGTAKGPFNLPAVNATLSGQGVQYNQYSVGRIDGRATLGTAENGALPFDVDLTAAAITTGDPTLDFALREDAKVVARGTFDQAEQTLTLDSANVKLADSTANVSGSVDLKAKQLNVAYDVNAVDLSPFAGIAKADLAGSLALKGTASGDFVIPAVDATLSGRGLRYAAYQVGAIDGTVSVGRAVDGFAPFDVDITGDGISLGDATLDNALGGRLRLNAAGAFNQAGQSIRLDRANAVTANATADLRGAIDLMAKRLDVAFDVDAAQLAAFAGLAKADVAGSLAIKGTASGDFVIPAVDATLSGQNLRYNQYLVGRIDGRAKVGVELNGALPFDVDLTASAISTGDPNLDYALGGEATVVARGSFNQTAKALQLDVLNARAGFASVNADGLVDIGGSRLDLRFDVDANDLSPLSGFVGKPVGGLLRASGTAVGPFNLPNVNVSAQGGGLYYDLYSLGGLNLDLAMPNDPNGALPFTLSGTATQPRLDNPAIESVIGETVSVYAVGVFDQRSQRLTLQDASIEAAIGRARVAGDVDLAAKMLGLDYQVDVADLGLAQSLAGKPLAGAAFISGRASGPFSDPSTSGQLTASSLLYDTYQLGNLSAQYDLQRLISGPAGAVSLDAQTGSGPLTANTRFDLTGGALNIESVNVNGLGLNLQGGFRSGPGGVLDGMATLNATDLSQLGGFVGQEIAGIADGNVTLTNDQGRQNVVFDLRGTGLRYSQQGTLVAAMGAFEARGNVSDARGQNPFIDATFGGSNGEVKGFPVQRIDATARGALSSLDTVVSGNGGITGSERIDAAALLNLANPPRSANISRLSLSYQGRQLAIVQPLIIEEIVPGGFRMTGLDVRAEDGEIRGDIEYQQSGVVAKLNIRNLPMQLAALSGVDLIRSGRLDGTVDIDTRGGARGNFDLQATTLRLKGAQIDDPFDLIARGTLDGTALNVTAEMSGAQLVQPLVATARIPLISVAGSPLPTPDNNAPFNAAVDWSGDVGEIWSFVPLPDHILSGPVVINGRATGTLASPTLSGGATLTGGSYSNLEFGTQLNNMNAKADFTSDGRVVFDLTSNDGVTGQISASGSYVVSSSMLDARMALVNAALVRRDDLTAVISGEATARSQGKDIAINGDFRTNYVELRLIGGFGGSLVVVDAIPVGKSAPIYTPPDESGGAGPEILLNVALSFPQQVFVRGRGLDSEWGGRLDVTGSASKPRVVGLIEKRRGGLDLLGKRFELSIGTVRFSGDTNPYVQVRLQRTANDITGWVEVIGTVPDVELEFGSIPALPEGEILPRLLFGRSKQSLTALEAAQLAAGVATLLSGKAGVLDSVRDAVGVDVLRVEGDDDGGTSVITGKYLRDEVFVGAKQNLSTGATSGLVEVDVFENFELEAELGSEESKASVGWEIEY